LDKSDSSKSIDGKIISDNKDSKSIDAEGAEINEIQTNSLSTDCNVIRICFCTFFSLCLVGFVIALMWRTTPIAVVAPIGIILVLSSFYFYSSLSQRQSTNGCCNTELSSKQAAAKSRLLAETKADFGTAKPVQNFQTLNKMF